MQRRTIPQPVSPLSRCYPPRRPVSASGVPSRVDCVDLRPVVEVAWEPVQRTTDRAFCALRHPGLTALPVWEIRGGHRPLHQSCAAFRGIVSPDPGGRESDEAVFPILELCQRRPPSRITDSTSVRLRSIFSRPDQRRSIYLYIHRNVLHLVGSEGCFPSLLQSVVDDRRRGDSFSIICGGPLHLPDHGHAVQLVCD